MSRLGSHTHATLASASLSACRFRRSIDQVMRSKGTVECRQKAAYGAGAGHWQEPLCASLPTLIVGLVAVIPVAVSRDEFEQTASVLVESEASDCC
jgi:hypothetical protein